MGPSKANRDSSPREHQESDPFTGTKFLEKIVGGNFENSVSNEKYHQSDTKVESGSAGFLSIVRSASSKNNAYCCAVRRCN
jgi:hypothetical protein